MKAIRYLLLVLAVLLLAVVATPFLIPAEQLRKLVEQEATSAAGMPVKIEALSVRIIPMPSLSIRNLAVEDVRGGTPKLTVASGSLAVELIPLFDGRAEISGLMFKEVALRISQQAKGKDVHIVRIDRVTGGIQLSEEKLTMPGWEAELYDGVVAFSAVLTPLEGDKRTLTADINATGIQMLPLMRDAAGQERLSGILRSRLKISARGADIKTMLHSLQVDGPVNINKGAVEGVGLSGIAAALVHGNITGAGSTILFDTFSSQLKVRGQDIYLKDIALNASTFDASGYVDIRGGSKLDGKITTSGMGGLSGAKLLVGGTTASPRIYPAPSSLIGGTIGATIGGPAGAAVGSKIGGAAGDVVESIGNSVKGLFGK